MVEESSEFDVVVIGGGIYGIMLALDASLRNLKVAVVEQNEWGSGTTAGWLRILHGGLRYLQSADLPRFYESVAERRWFLRHFPDLTAPLPCLMPLYRQHSYPRLLMKTALAMNDVLAVQRNRGVIEEARLPGGGLLGASQVREALPFVETADLVGAACWYDAVVLEPHQLLLELLSSAESNGAIAWQRTEAVKLLRTGGVIRGLETRDRTTGKVRELYSRVVINATGHWAPELAKRFGAEIDNAPRSSWAWNVLFDLPSNAECAAAVSARRPGSQMFFILPWRGRTLVGTGHALIPEGADNGPVPRDLIIDFIEQVSEAVPALNLKGSAIARVYQGVLPAANRTEMRLTARPLIIDHGKNGNKGLYTVWGIKYTTARRIANRLLDKVFPSHKRRAYRRRHTV